MKDRYHLVSVEVDMLMDATKGCICGNVPHKNGTSYRGEHHMKKRYR
jgi:hypothetical protein